MKCWKTDVMWEMQNKIHHRGGIENRKIGESKYRKIAEMKGGGDETIQNHWDEKTESKEEERRREGMKNRNWEGKDKLGRRERFHREQKKKKGMEWRMKSRN